MNRYIKDNRVIMATPKAYEVVYKPQGFIPYEGQENNVVQSLENLTVSQLKAMANSKGLEYDSKIKKEDLLILLQEEGELDD
ncbi:hypothetical protein GMB70_14325 [Turicibacter sanguinis]|nr:hypothetical protein [Turicibacter sanguinis]